MKTEERFAEIKDPGLRAALSAYSPNVERGALTAFAAALGRTVSAISQWTKIPVELVPQVVELTGVSREVLRPDVFGPPAKSARKRA